MARGAKYGKNRGARGGICGGRASILSLASMMALVFAVAFCDLSLSQDDTSEPTVRIKTKEGVEATVKLANTFMGPPMSQLDDYVAGTKGAGNGAKIPVQLGEGVYLGIPIGLFCRADSEGQGHIIDLANGQRVKGKLLGDILSSNGKHYDLSSVISMVPITVPQREQGVGQQAKQSRKVWQLHVLQPIDITYRVSNLRFSFKYRSRVGYDVGVGVSCGESESFYVRAGNDLIQARPIELERISFAKSDGSDIQASYKSKLGGEVKGILVLNEKDTDGVHAGYDPLLVAEVAEYAGTVIAVQNPTCSLIEVRE